MGFTEAADHYTHFSYEMVAMTPRCAIELGYTYPTKTSSAPSSKSAAARATASRPTTCSTNSSPPRKAEVDTRHPEIAEAERLSIATQIAVGALRYFMLRFTRNTVIAFDFKDALSFEGETGPYVQYAIVRAANIFRKAGTTEEAALAAIATLDLSASSTPKTEPASGRPGCWPRASPLLIEQAIATAEPAYLANYAFQLAQQFNNFYHRHHVLTRDRSHPPRASAGHRRGRPARDGPRARLSRHRSPAGHVAIERLAVRS